MTTRVEGPIDGVDLSLIEFWQQPLEGRDADFAKLRALGRPAYFIVPEGPLSTPGDGYYAFVSHADVAAASRSRSCSRRRAARRVSKTCRPSSTSTSVP